LEKVSALLVDVKAIEARCARFARILRPPQREKEAVTQLECRSRDAYSSYNRGRARRLPSARILTFNKTRRLGPNTNLGGNHR